MLSIKGDNLQFCPIFHIGGDENLDHDFVQVSKLSEDQKTEHFFPQIQVKTKKKKVFTKNGTLFSPNSDEDQKKIRSSPKVEHFFSPNSSGDLRSHAHQSQIIGGDADEDHTQIIGGDTVKLFPHPSRVSASPDCNMGTELLALHYINGVKSAPKVGFSRQKPFFEKVSF